MDDKVEAHQKFRLKQKFKLSKGKKSVLYTPNISELNSFYSEKSEEKPEKGKTKHILSLVKSKFQPKTKSIVTKEQFLLRSGPPKEESAVEQFTQESLSVSSVTSFEDVSEVKRMVTLNKERFLALESKIAFNIFSFVFSDYAALMHGDKAISTKIAVCLKDKFYPFVASFKKVFSQIFQVTDYYFDSRQRNFKTNTVQNSAFLSRS